MGISTGGIARVSAASSGGFGGDDFSLVVQKLVPAGKHLKAGEVVAEFDRLNMLQRVDDIRDDFEQMDADLEKLHASQEADIKAEQLAIEQAKAALDKARLDLKTVPVKGAIDSERLRLAEEQAAASYKQLVEAAKLNDIVRKAALRSNEIDRERQKIQLQQAEANADKMLIKTPIDGIAVMGTTRRGTDQVQIQAGDELHPGEIFVRVVDQSSMIVNATVNQSDLELIRVGAKAQVRFDAYPDLVLPGHVYAVAAMAAAGGFRAQYVRQVPVSIKLDQLDSRVIPDLSVSVDVILGSEPNATIAPLQAIFYDAPDKPYVLVQKPDGWERREVQLGLSNNIAVAIRSGLRAGEVVATERPRQTQQGQRRPG
jgi:multidrug efflux pump subunit AcrA (membrane-fusion protein)